MLIFLVGTLEFLVTRNPDTNKFNVEDSISKQFKLKCSMLIHTQEPSLAIDEVSAELQTIYNQRSDFAHGNYIDNYDEDKIAELNLTLFNFIRIVMKSYIKDRSLVDYLKDN